MAQSGREQLVDYLKRSRLKAFELAELLGIHPAAMSKVLLGRRPPTLSLAVRIADRTGIPVQSWVPSGRGRSKNVKRASAKQANVSGVATDVAQS